MRSLVPVPTAAPGAIAIEPRRLGPRDREFLPAAIAIVETPASPLRSAIIVTICAFTASAVAWAYLGRVDIIASAPGKIQPVGQTKVIQPVEPGKVGAILVANGRAVRAGDPLVLLDPGDAEADEATLRADLLSLKAAALRRRLAIAAVTERTVATWPADIGDLPREMAEREQRVLTSALAQLNATVADLQAQLAEKLAGRNRLKTTIAAQQQLLATLRQRVDMRLELLSRNAESKASVIDAEEAYQGQQTALATQQGQLEETEAAVQVARREIDRAYASFLAENAEKLAQAEREIGTGAEKLAKARLKTGRMVLRSPIAGTVQGLTVTTLGQVLSAGEHIMEIVPGGSRLEIECYLSNADVAFVKAGQPAAVKVDSLPFTTYGTLEAKVSGVAGDAIAEPEAEQRERNPAQPARGALFGGSQPVQNLLFPVTLDLKALSLERQGAVFPLTPGMTVTVEIKTGSRRIADYLFAPLIEVTSSALHER